MTKTQVSDDVGGCASLAWLEWMESLDGYSRSSLYDSTNIDESYNDSPQDSSEGDDDVDEDDGPAS